MPSCGAKLDTEIYDAKNPTDKMHEIFTCIQSAGHEGIHEAHHIPTGEANMVIVKWFETKPVE